MNFNRQYINLSTKFSVHLICRSQLCHYWYLVVIKRNWLEQFEGCGNYRIHCGLEDKAWINSKQGITTSQEASNSSSLLEEPSLDIALLFPPLPVNSSHLFIFLSFTEKSVPSKNIQWTEAMSCAYPAGQRTGEGEVGLFFPIGHIQQKLVLLN